MERFRQALRRSRFVVLLVTLSTFSYSVEANNFAVSYRVAADQEARLEEMAKRLGMPVEKLRQEQPGLVDALKGLFTNQEEAARQAGLARVEAQLKKMAEQVAANPFNPNIQDVKNAYQGHRLDGLLRDLSQLTSTRVLSLPVASRKALLRNIRASLKEDLVPYVPDDLPGKSKGRHNQLKGKLNSLYAKLRPILNDPDAISDEKLAQTLGKVAAEVNELVKRPEKGPRFDNGRPLPLQLQKKEMPTQEATAPVIGSSSALVQSAPAPMRSAAAPAVAPEIAALAQSLGNSPSRIFAYVHDTIRFDSKWGAVRGPVGTLQEGEGTSWDQAWLLAELLRAAGADARLEWGQVEVPIDLLLTLTGTTDPFDAGTLLTTGGVPGVLLVQGGKVVGARLSHVWVQAHVDYVPNRGVTPGPGDTWIRMDPSFKRYGQAEGIDVHSHVPYSLEGYLQSGTPLSPRRAYEDALWSYIRANNIVCTTLDQLKRSAQVKREQFPFIPGTLRGKILRSDGTSETVPDTFQQRLALEVRTAAGSTLVSWASPAPALHGKRVEITYVGATSEDQGTIDAYGSVFETPPYLIDLKPTVRVAGATVAQGSAVGSAADTEVWVTMTPPSGAPTVVTHTTSAGERHVLAVDFGELPQAVIDAHQTALNAAVVAGNQAEAEAETLYLLGAQYLHNLGRDLTDLSGWKWQRLVRLGTEGLISQTGVVTTTVGGAPISFRPGQRNVDIALMPLGMVPADGRDQFARESFELLGTQSSFLEGEVFNQVLQREGIASVSALTLSKRNGQTLTRVDGANVDAILSQADLGADAESEVRAAVTRGRIAWVAQSRLQLSSWTGTGYVLEDPATGAAAYLISGGFAGGDEVDEFVGASTNLVGTEWWLESSPLGALLTLLGSLRPGLIPENGPGTNHGDPINLATGNFWITESDFSVLSLRWAVPWRRYYNSRSDHNGDLGFGWTHSFGERLEEQPDGSIRFREEDGTEHLFPLIQGQGYASPAGKHLTLIRDASGFELRTKEGIVSRFTPEGRLLSITDRNDNSLTLSYDPLGNLSSVSDATGRVVLNLTTENGRIVRVADFTGRYVEYEYEGDDLVAAVDRLRERWSYDYDEAHNMVARANPLGETSSYAYDVLDRCYRHVDPLGTMETFHYTRHGSRSVLQDMKGNDSFFEFDDRGRATLKVDPLGNASRSEWDADNNRTSTTDPRGGVTARTYDSQGNLLSETDPANRTTTYTYDPVHQQLTSIVDPTNHSITLSYDGNGNLVRVSESAVSQEVVQLFEHDSSGQPVELRDPNGNITTLEWNPANGMVSSRTVGGNTVEIGTDSLGRIETVTLSPGQEVQLEWDAADRLVAYTDLLGNRESREYDKAGRLTSITGLKGTSIFVYDAAGRLVEGTDRLGNRSKTEYDAAGSVMAHIDPRGARTSFMYDALSRPSSMIDPVGNVWSFGYCAEISGTMSSFEPCELTDPLGRTTRRAFDPLGRTTSFTAADGTVTRFGYDDQTRKRTLTDALDRVTEYRFDEVGRLIGTVATDSAETQLTYDPNGNVVKIHDAEGHDWTREFDALNRLVKEIDPLEHFATYSYDAAGRLRSWRDQNGQEVSMDLDRGLVTAVRLPDGSQETFTHDRFGRRTSMANSEVSLSYEYDDLDRLVKVTNQTLNKVISYEYDANGNVVRTTGPKGAVQSFYDARNLLVEQRDPVAGTFRWTYDALGRRTALEYPNGAVAGYSYDPLGRLESILVKSQTGQVIDGFSYGYDDLGRQVSRRSLRNGAEEEFLYDSGDRLARWQSGPEQFEELTYDKVGNRLSRTGSGGSVSYAYDEANRLLEEDRQPVTGAPSLVSYQWDANGNLTSRTEGAATTSYRFDALNRLRDTVEPAGSRSFGYDPNGIRVRETGGGVTSRFLHSFEDILATYDGNGSELSYYSHGPRYDEPLAQSGASGLQYLHGDGQGSITSLTADSGEVVGRASYSPFGGVLAASGVASRYGYTGRELDSGGLMYYRARYLDTESGRFLSRDPFRRSPRDMGGANPYAYVRNNPLSFVDPTGLVEWVCNLYHVAVSFPLPGIIGTGVGTGLVWWNNDSSDPAYPESASVLTVWGGISWGKLPVSITWGSVTGVQPYLSRPEAFGFNGVGWLFSVGAGIGLPVFPSWLRVYGYFVNMFNSFLLPRPELLTGAGPVTWPGDYQACGFDLGLSFGVSLNALF